MLYALASNNNPRIFSKYCLLIFGMSEKMRTVEINLRALSLNEINLKGCQHFSS